jgi:TM2 domain-containing membrane protein YozV
MMNVVQIVPDKSTGVAYLLLIFFGVFGVHQFYLGKAGRGVGYLLTLGWLTVGLWIDLFTLASQVKAVNTQRRMGVR